VNIDRRLKEHKNELRKNKHFNPYLQNAWNKYGEKNFKFEIIETIHDIKQLLTREKEWIDNTRCYKKEIGFNISIDPSAPKAGVFVDLTNQKFGRLTPVKHVGQDKNGNSLWLCKCECNNEKIISSGSFKNGNTKSCGCLYKNSNNNFKHGNIKNKKQSKTYTAWAAMKDRCSNPNTRNYKNFGGKKISVCSRWLEKDNGFQNFLDDMGECSPGLSLYRIDRTKNYFKENCRWDTKKEQERNKGNNNLITYKGKTQCLSAWAEEYNIRKDTLWRRLYKYGWSIEKALTTSVGIYEKKEKK
jgi:hypothetical protein